MATFDARADREANLTFLLVVVVFKVLPEVEVIFVVVVDEVLFPFNTMLFLGVAFGVADVVVLFLVLDIVVFVVLEALAVVLRDAARFLGGNFVSQKGLASGI